MSNLLTAMSSAASALDAQRVRMEVAISNLSNAETTGELGGEPYRRREVMLEAVPVDDGTGNRGAFSVRVAQILEDQSEFRRRFEPSNANAGPDGYVDVPNVDVPEEMVDLLSAARAYQANLAAITLIRETVQKSLEIGRV